MSRGRGQDHFRLARTSILDVLNSNLRSSYLASTTPSRSETYDIYPQSSNVRSSDDLSVEGTHEPEEYRTSRSLNTIRDSDRSSSRSSNVPMSSALDNLQNYGTSDQSPLHSQDWSLDFLKNINSNKKASQISSSMKNVADSYRRSPESKYFGDTGSCSTLSDLNLKTVEEEDEFLYGDSNSLPEIPKSVKKVPDIEDVKNVWSDEDDLFQDSPKKKSNSEASRNVSVWNLRNKSAAPNSPQAKFQNQTIPVGRKIISETTETLKSSSMEQQKPKLFASNPTPEKRFISEDMRVAAGSVNKSKYHAAAQVLKKQSMEKSRNLMNENLDLSHRDDFLAVKEKSSRSIDEEQLVYESRISSEDLKHDKIPEKNVRQIPKAFLQKDLQMMKNYAKGPDRKRVYSPENYEQELKHPRHRSPRDSSPSRHSPYDSSRHRSPGDDYKYRPSSHSMHRPHPSDFKYKIPPYSHRKSPPRDYERHSYEFSPRYDERKHYPRSPPRRSSRERSPGYYRFKEKLLMKRSRERSRSPEYYRYKAKSPMKRSRERSRSPGYYKSRDSSPEHQYRKKSYKGSPENHPKLKKKKDYSSDDSFCSLSLGSDSYSSDDSSNSHSRKEKRSRSRSKKIVSKDLKAPTVKVETKPDVVVKVDKDVDKPMSSKDFAQSLEQMCNFKDKTSEASDIPDNIPKLFNKDEEDKLINIVKMFENSQLLTELVEGVQDPASSLASSVLPMVDTSQNLALPLQNPAVMNMPFPHSYPVGPVPPNVPVHYPPSQIPNFSPLPFRPPLVMQATPPTSMLEPFPQAVQQSTLVEIPRIPDTKPVAKKRPQTLRPISLQKSSESTSSSPQKQIETKGIKPSKDSVVVDQKQFGNIKPELLKAYSELIEKYKKLKAERHLVRVKVNSSVGDLCEMRKIMDESWGKKKTASEAVIHSKCKHIISISQDNLSIHVKEAKRLDDEINRLRGKMPRELQVEISNIKIEPAKEESNVFYSGYDKGSHTCFICYQQFQNLSSVLEHFQSEEHMEQMNLHDKEWQNSLNKQTELEAGKKLSLKPVQGIEFMKPLAGFYCTLCSQTLFDNSSAESHLKSHDHFVNSNEYILKHPLYERKCLLKQFIMHAKKNKLKEMQVKEEQMMNRKKLEAVEEKVKEMIKDQVSKEKIVDELKEIDDKAIASSNQNSGGIKLTLTGEGEKAKEVSKEKDTKEKSTSKAAQKIYIGKAPNFKARPKPWYKREIYQKNESPPKDSLPSVSKESVLAGDVSKSVQIDSKTKALGKTDQSLKKTAEHTCLTEEASEKLSADSRKEKLPVTKDPVVNQAIKNILLGTDSSMHKDIPLYEIKLPEIPVQTADSSANPTSQGESHNPLPMEIEEPPETYTPSLPPPQKLTAEEEKDFYILGINREDFRPLVVPVPPPSSLMNPTFYKTVPPPTVVCNAKTVPPPTLVCDTSVPPPTLVCDTSVPPPNFNINLAQQITVPPPPLTISAHLNNALNPKPQSPEFKPVKTNPNLIRIVPTKSLKSPDSPIKTVNKNVVTSPVKLADAPTKTVGKNLDSTSIKRTDSPVKTVSKTINITPVKLVSSATKTVVTTPEKNPAVSKENNSNNSLDKNLKDESSEGGLKSNKNSSSGAGEKISKQNSSRSSEISAEKSKPDSSEGKNIKCDTSANMIDSANNLSKSESPMEIEVENKCVSGKVDDSTLKQEGQEDASSEVSLVSKDENKSSSVVDVKNEEKVKSEVCENISKPTLVEADNTNSDTSTQLVDSKSNLSQSDSTIKIKTENVCATSGEVSELTIDSQADANSEILCVIKDENQCSRVVEVQNEKQVKSEVISETSKSVSPKSEDITKSDSVTPLTVPSDDLIQTKSEQNFAVENRDTALEEKEESIVKSNDNICNIIGEFLEKSESVKEIYASEDITSKNESTSKCIVEDENIKSVSKKFTEKNETPDEKQLPTTSKENLMLDDDSSCCIIEDTVSEEQSLPESCETNLDTSKSDPSKVENITKSNAASSLLDKEEALSECDSDSFMEVEDEDMDIQEDSEKAIESLTDNKLDVSFDQIKDDSDSKINQMSSEGQAASVKFENVSETSVSSKIEKDANCKEITSLNVPADNLDQSESVMETDAEDVPTISEKNNESTKFNKENSTNSIKNSISLTVEGQQVIEQNEPEICKTVSTDKISVRDKVTIPENTHESIKEESFKDSSNESQNELPTKVCVTSNENSSSSVVKSMGDEESALKTYKTVSESCESTSSEIENTSKNVTEKEVSAPITQFHASPSPMEVDNDSMNVVSEEVDGSGQKHIIQDCNDESSSLKSNNFTVPDKDSPVHCNSGSSAESETCKESDDNKANIFLVVDDTISETGNQVDSKTIYSEEAQSLTDPNPHKISSEEKSSVKMSSTMVDSMQTRDSTELTQNVTAKKILGQSVQEELPDKSDMEICSSTIQELIDLKEAQKNSEELDLESNKAKASSTQNPASESVDQVPEKETSGNTQEVSHHESSTEVIVQDQDAENKVVGSEGEKASLPDNVDETENLSKSDTDTEEYEEVEED